MALVASPSSSPITQSWPWDIIELVILAVLHTANTDSRSILRLMLVNSDFLRVVMQWICCFCHFSVDRHRRLPTFRQTWLTTLATTPKVTTPVTAIRRVMLGRLPLQEGLAILARLQHVQHWTIEDVNITTSALFQTLRPETLDVAVPYRGMHFLSNFSTLRSLFLDRIIHQDDVDAWAVLARLVLLEQLCIVATIPPATILAQQRNLQLLVLLWGSDIRSLKRIDELLALPLKESAHVVILRDKRHPVTRFHKAASGLSVWDVARRVVAQQRSMTESELAESRKQHPRPIWT
ncbi:hypothetical protein MIND_01075500 [Mycena indigotica]|uniref:Uncharacterized protein n=1 Tax=Mycena indigotica TaxID=2126181 RepID=A0A8H6SCJ2_9AGAR|nr:uncharacterized protein MIND_01075300 [Mycena indigotica]XP_037216723.1 uncharacterized protein MIND_01075500 [Mycena indigotica]KAF7295358.1 hypothetical protein MIND_01075300 [Mycena indigotica]KAF7295360.1 hypothetical protein MIND_01075500 [Mycena indigotica]